MNNIKSYIIINKKTNLITELFMAISILVFITLLILTQYKYKKYYQTIGQVIKENNEYKITLYIDPYKLNIIKSNNTMLINDEKYSYKINYIDNEYLLSDDLNNYLRVVLNVNLNNKDRINNNILNIKILESDKKMISYLKDYLRKE